MINSIWVKKIGMTQFFSPNNKSKVIPVTVVDLGRWYILQRKTISHDGYSVIQVGIPREKYMKTDFSFDWLKDKKKYFAKIKETSCADDDSYKVGDLLSFNKSIFQASVSISVTGVTKGKGFQGVVRRYGFSGGRGSHGDTLGRRPGSLGSLRTQGRVFKGKKMPGHMGAITKTIFGLTIIDVHLKNNALLISGPVPGNSGSFIKITAGGR